jgi:1-acyl-sn-glycerol-3-phosphate acyltransferase
MQSVRYPLPWGTACRLAFSILRQQERSIRWDGLRCLNSLRYPMRLKGKENIPPAGPFLITCNHYTRPGLPAWWIAIGISASISADVHWVMTSAFTFHNHLIGQHLTPVSRLILSRVARAYRFLPMPPMPPDPRQVAERAAAVRRILAFIRHNPNAVIGLAPEGRDGPGSVLQMPPEGSGRFIVQLTRRGFPILPAGVYEEERALCVRFGSAYDLSLPGKMPHEQLDRCTIQIVMQAIADLLPMDLRGEWAASKAV